MSRILSGQAVGLPLTNPLIEATSPQHLTGTIYQRKLSSKDYKAANKPDKDEELVETIEAISDINTDTEFTDETSNGYRRRCCYSRICFQ